MRIFTDGSSKKYGKCWCGGIGVYCPKNKNVNVSAALQNGTNQSAELFAAVAGILNCLSVNKQKIHVYSDRLYTIKCATLWGKTWEKNGWQKKKILPDVAP